MSKRFLVTALLCISLTPSSVLADECPDVDKDGYTDQRCGGQDCDDTDAAIHPDAEDIPNDGIDQNCDGVDFTQNCDQDGDGFQALVCGGNDCNDLDATVYVGAVDPEGDGIDQDCSGDESCEPTTWVQGPRTCDTTSGTASIGLFALMFLAGRRRRRHG